MTMTIDEIKVRLINLMKPIRINLMNTEIEVRQEEQYPYLKPIFEALECTIDCLEELQWYREQDLIRREDADNILYNEPIMDVGGACYGMKKPSLNTLKERLTNIPKAEPLKMRDLNAEEIKNTNNYLKSASQPTGIHFFEAETTKENE